MRDSSKQRALTLLSVNNDQLSAGILFGYAVAMSLYDADAKKLDLDISKFPKIKSIKKTKDSRILVEAEFPQAQCFNEPTTPPMIKHMSFDASDIHYAMSRLGEPLSLKNECTVEAPSIRRKVKVKTDAIDRGLAMALARVKILAKKEEMLDYVASSIDHTYNDQSGLYGLLAPARAALRDAQLRLHRDLMMWGSVVGGSIEKLAKKFVLLHSMTNGYGIMHVLQPEINSRSYSCDDEFREDLTELAKSLELSPFEFMSDHQRADFIEAQRIAKKKKKKLKKQTMEVVEPPDAEVSK